MKLLSFLVGLVLSGAAPAQQDVIFRLDGAGIPQGGCDFQTTTGVHVSSAHPGELFAAGRFVSGNCGTPSVAAAELSATPLVVDEGGVAEIAWGGMGDVCRDDGSVFPHPVAGWPVAGGDVCLGSYDCGAGGIIAPTFLFEGTYTFKMKCVVGSAASHPQETAFASATVEVHEDSPPPSGCDMGPQGFSRQLVGDISLASNTPSSRRNNVDMTEFVNVYGQNLGTGEAGIPWPGVLNSDVKLTVNSDQFLSMEFTVPPGMPIYNGTSPWGGFSTNPTLTTGGVAWTMSITEDCGDFTLSQPTDPDHDCYAGYSTDSGINLSWVVSGMQQDLSGVCNLKPGHSYFLNVIAAPVGNPTQPSCTINACKNNFKNAGSF